MEDQNAVTGILLAMSDEHAAHVRTLHEEHAKHTKKLEAERDAAIRERDAALTTAENERRERCAVFDELMRERRNTSDAIAALEAERGKSSSGAGLCPICHRMQLDHNGCCHYCEALDRCEFLDKERDAALAAAKSARWLSVYGPMVAVELSKHEPPTVPILESIMRYARRIADQAEEAYVALEKNRE